LLIDGNQHASRRYPLQPAVTGFAECHVDCARELDGCTRAIARHCADTILRDLWRDPSRRLAPAAKSIPQPLLSDPERASAITEPVAPSEHGRWSTFQLMPEQISSS